MSLKKQNVLSGSPFEESIGFSRACRIDNQISVSGTAPLSAGKTVYKGDVYEQTKHCLQLSLSAISEAGGSIEGVIRTRIMLTDISQWQHAARAHGELFAQIKPACTFVQVSAFIDPDWLVETEMDALVLD